MFFKVFVCCFTLFAAQTNGQNEGDRCTKNGMQGVCTNVRKCQSAVDDIKNQRGSPQICSFSSTDPIVCCVDTTQTAYRPPVATTSTSRPKSTTGYVTPVKDYVMKVDEKPTTKDGCGPVAAKLTAKKTGQKAWDKCIEYQHRLIYPCEKGVALSRTMSRANKCKHTTAILVLGGVPAAYNEFPHMVLLGYGDIDSIAWDCGGSLLSERFILTAGHCTYSRFSGELKYARTGVLRRDEPLDPSRFYKISNIVKHPEYKPPSKYNDIALLETDTEIILDELVVPACLDVGRVNDYSEAIATGWGATQNRGAKAEQLQKVTLKKFSSDECTEFITPYRNLLQGVNNDTQMCYGDKEVSKDTCQGDSGGPLQVKNKEINCMYTIVGVTSYGSTCGIVGLPGVYTRVERFVPWIESIVWP